MSSKKIIEDAPANNAGGGGVAGIGVGPQGEPGRKAIMTPMLKRHKFAGHTVFEVKTEVFHKARMQKRKGQHWSKYLEEDEHCHEIREYANKKPGKAIVLQDERSGAMFFARYGKDKR